ncbi:MAG TPA: SprT-like domain-containing protein [Gemmatimonadales bacterium]
MSRKSARRDEDARVADEALLTRRLAALGLRVRRVAVHSNRTVMVSVSRGTLRIHRGYAYASDRVLNAIVKFVYSRTRVADRRDAERELLAFPAHQFGNVVRSRPEGARPGDRAILSKLRQLHTQLNARHFGGALTRIPFRLSAKMRTQLGEVTLDDRTGRAVEIGMSRQHVARDGWLEVQKTLVHEMIHQWQAETGLAVDHGPTFRRKAREVGVEPSARRDLDTRPAADIL